MSSLETPLHKVRGLGASHSGTGHFWHERVTAVALIPLTIWFVSLVGFLFILGALTLWIKAIRKDWKINK